MEESDNKDESAAAPTPASDGSSEPRTDTRLSPRARVAYWLVGTALASVLPVVGVIVATISTENKTLTWSDICSHGDFLIIGAVLVIGGTVEIIRALVDGCIPSEWRGLAGALTIGGVLLLIVQLILYPLVLSNALKRDMQVAQAAAEAALGQATPGASTASSVTPNPFIETASTVGSPILLVLAVVFGAAVVRLSIGRPA